MWTGPISASVFVPEVEMDATRVYIEYLRKCDQKLKDQVTFHFLFPYEKAPNSDERLRSMSDDYMSTNMSRKELLGIIMAENFCSDTNRLLKRIFASRR